MRRNGRRRFSLGTLLMILLTAGVILASMAFLVVITGGRMPERVEAEMILPAAAQARDAAPRPEPQTTAMMEAEPTVQPTPSPTAAPSRSFLTLAAAGSVYAPKAVRESAQENGDHYDFSGIFDGLGDTLSRADLAIVTLETTTAGRERGYGNYNTPPQVLDALRGCGVDLASLATEHILDKGYEGLDLTLSELTSRALAYAGVSPEGPKDSPAAMLNIDGVQAAVLAYSYGLSDEGREKTNGDERGVLSMLEIETMVQDITKARADGAELVIVLPHWGTKNKREIPDSVRSMARILAEAGADVILGTHPNVVQETERLTVTRRDGLEYETVVCYSLGSLLTDARTEENTAGMAIFLPVEYDPMLRRVTLGELDIVPLYVARQREGRRTVYHVVNAEDEAMLESLDKGEQEAARRAAEIVRAAAGQEEP